MPFKGRTLLVTSRSNTSRRHLDKLLFTYGRIFVQIFVSAPWFIFATSSMHTFKMIWFSATSWGNKAKSCTSILLYTRSDLSLRSVDLLPDLYIESDLSPWRVAATCRLVSRPLFGRFTSYFSRIDDTTIFSHSDFGIVFFLLPFLSLYALWRNPRWH